MNRAIIHLEEPLEDLFPAPAGMNRREKQVGVHDALSPAVMFVVMTAVEAVPFSANTTRAFCTAMAETPAWPR
jgi:hypothetical protein